VTEGFLVRTESSRSELEPGWRTARVATGFELRNFGLASRFEQVPFVASRTVSPVWTDWVGLHDLRNSLTANEKQLGANHCDELFCFWVGATRHG